MFHNLAFFVLAAVALSSGATKAQSLEDLAVGEVEFNISCASCHGITGIGNGPLARFMLTRPIDLTELAKNNGGTYPAAMVHAAIDGRGDVGSHGDSDMPVWGIRYLREYRSFWAAQDDEALVDERIERLVAYISTLQKP